MNSPIDGASGRLLPKSSIDQSVGWLVVGIGVILFFLLTVMGMSEVEHQTSEAAGHHGKHAAIVSEGDIVGTLPPPPAQ